MVVLSMNGGLYLQNFSLENCVLSDINDPWTPTDDFVAKKGKQFIYFCILDPTAFRVKCSESITYRV